MKEMKQYIKKRKKYVREVIVVLNHAMSLHQTRKRSISIFDLSSSIHTILAPAAFVCETNFKILYTPKLLAPMCITGKQQVQKVLICKPKTWRGMNHFMFIKQKMTNKKLV